MYHHFELVCTAGIPDMVRPRDTGYDHGQVHHVREELDYQSDSELKCEIMVIWCESVIDSTLMKINNTGE